MDPGFTNGCWKDEFSKTLILFQIHNFTCSCTPQFMGPTCDTAYNACVEQSCQNGGQCVVTNNERDPGKDFYCECPQGFNGLRCENNVNECEGVVCTDNKICVDLVRCMLCSMLYSAFFCITLPFSASNCIFCEKVTDLSTFARVA